MGSVKLETKNQGRGCHQWDNVSLNSEDVIDVLIRYRSKFEESYISKELYTRDIFKTNGLPEFVEIITCLYVDLDNYIKSANLYKIENFIIKRFMLGYNLSDVREIVNKKLNKDYGNVTIKQVYKNAVRKILFEYNYNYQYWLESSENVKIDDKKNFKICKKCNKSLERSYRNFYRNKRSRDNLDYICKKCKNNIWYKNKHKENGVTL